MIVTSALDLEIGEREFRSLRRLLSGTRAGRVRVPALLSRLVFRYVASTFSRLDSRSETFY